MCGASFWHGSRSGEQERRLRSRLCRSCLKDKLLSRSSLSRAQMILGCFESRSTEDGTKGVVDTQHSVLERIICFKSPHPWYWEPLALVSQHRWDVHGFGNGCKEPPS